jgi:hypothetical protein
MAALFKKFDIFIKCDSINNKYTNLKMFRYYFCRDLGYLRVKISKLTERLTPKVIKIIEAKKFSFLALKLEIFQLVFLRQKYIARLSKQYGMYSIKVQLFFIESITRLEMRIFAIEQTHQLFSSKLSGVDKIVLTKYNKLFFFKKLKLKELKNYRPNSCRVISTPRGSASSQFLRIPTIHDRLIQMLFMLLLDPMIESSIDFNCYSF